MKIATLTKLSHLRDPHAPEELAAANSGDTFQGVFFDYPKPKHSFTLNMGFNGGFITSMVVSVYHHGSASECDKLVLPKNFPDAVRLEFPDLKKGDVLFATMNSVYLLNNIVEVPNDHGEDSCL